MALRVKLTKQERDALPAHLQTEYVEKNGMFYIDFVPVDGWSLEDVTGLRNALGAERAKATDLETKLQAVKDIDPAKARDALSKVDEMSKWTPEQKVQELIAAREAQLSGKHGTEKTQLESELKVLRAQLDEHLVSNTLLLAMEGKAKSKKALLANLLPHVRVDKNPAGLLVAVVIDPKTGHPRVTTRSGSNENMSISELVDEGRKDPELAPLYIGSGSSGSGAPSGGGGGGAPQPTIDQTLPPTEQLKQFRRGQKV